MCYPKVVLNTERLLKHAVQEKLAITVCINKVCDNVSSPLDLCMAAGHPIVVVISGCGFILMILVA